MFLQMMSSCVSSSISRAHIDFSHYWSPNMTSITAIHLNGMNYATRPKSTIFWVRNNLLFSLMILQLIWHLQIGRLRMHRFTFKLWNNIEADISGTLVFLDTAIIGFATSS